MKRNWILELLHCWAMCYMNAAGFILYSGGGDAPDPDPRIGEAALKNAAIADKAFTFYSNEYERYRPQMEASRNLADQVTEQQLASSKLNGELAADYQNYMKETFRPLEKQLIDQATSYNTVGRQESEAAKGVSDVKQAFDVTRAQTARNNERKGINPNSGNAAAIQGGLDVQESIASANAANQGRTRAEQTGRAMVADAANMGRGLASNQATSTQIASNQAGAAISANAAGNAAQLQGLNIQGQGFQTGIQGNQSAANILNSQYQGQLQAYGAQQSADAASSAGWGQAAGMAAAAFLADGGKVDASTMGLDDTGNVIDNTTGEIVPHAKGRVAGPGTATSDSIPAQLSDGEGVLNEGAMKLLEFTLGLDAFDNLNEKGLKFRGNQNGI
jgi:hypothetical protein